MIPHLFDLVNASNCLLSCCPFWLGSPGNSHKLHFFLIELLDCKQTVSCSQVLVVIVAGELNSTLYFCTSLISGSDLSVRPRILTLVQVTA